MFRSVSERIFYFITLLTRKFDTLFGNLNPYSCRESVLKEGIKHNTMPKTRVQKEEILSKLTDRLGRSQGVVLVGTQAVKVDEIEQIRDGLYEHGLQFQVAKNSLLKRALEETKTDVPAELLDQPLALIYSYADPVAAARLLMPFTKDIENLKVLGGIVDGNFVTAAQVEALAKLPSREQLLGQLVGTLQAPLSGFVNVLAGNIRGLVNVLSAVRDSKAA